MDAINALIKQDPFALTLEDRTPLFHAAIKESFKHHINSNPLMAKYCKKKGLDMDAFPEALADLPYLPVGLFKTNLLASVKDSEIKKTLYSSATSGTPSKVVIDKTTSQRQSLVSSSVMAHYLGNHRRPLIILDKDPYKNPSTELGARLAATTGFLVFSNKTHYVMGGCTDKLQLDINLLEKTLLEYQNSEEECCLFGFTYVLYHHVVKVLKEKGKQFKLSPKTKIIHIGGWKKLEDQKVSKDVFLADIEHVFSIPKENIVDFYGFTEQMGLVYANTGDSPKTVPAYAELIIRDTQTLEPVGLGKSGFIQLITPIPNSYPGISILTEDIGRIVSMDPDTEGRTGTKFEILGRARKAEIRGCGDVMSEYVS